MLDMCLVSITVQRSNLSNVYDCGFCFVFFFNANKIYAMCLENYEI